MDVSGWLEENREHLVKKVNKKIYNIIPSYRRGSMPMEESIKTMDITLGYIIDFLRDKEISPNLENGLITADIIKFEDGIASRRAVYEIELVDLLRGIKIFRDEVWSLIASRLEDKTIEAVEFLRLEKRINTFMNYMMLRVSESYMRNLGEVLQSQETALMRWEEVVKSASNIELKIPCRPEFAGIVRMQAEAIARRLHYNEEEVQDIKTAVGEACDNSIEHGMSQNGVDVHYHLSMDELQIEVIDYGRGFDSTGKGDEPPDPFAERGRGLFLMKYLMDRVEIYSKAGEGTMMVLAKNRKFLN
ncbi:MAG: ATP-binding protein [Firmicutes bacterium]|nr:ATP-binding protein [Bacillota bacterium]